MHLPWQFRFYPDLGDRYLVGPVHLYSLTILRKRDYYYHLMALFYVLLAVGKGRHFFLNGIVTTKEEEDDGMIRAGIEMNEKEN